jgi:hypothetical protein
MNRPLIPARFLFLLLTLGSIAGCVKTSSIVNSSIPNPNPTPGSTDTLVPVMTNVGTPTGNPVSKTIGPAGGSIASADGTVQLTIPAGALSTSIVITIQPVSNECPGGLGLGYDFLPNGTQFAKPATISFNYAQDDSLNDPNLFFIAYQDQDNSWMADLAGVSLDTLGKTVSLDISHFTIYQVFAGMYIYDFQNGSEYERGQHNNLYVQETFNPEYATTVVNNSPIKLGSAIVPGSAIDHWALLFTGPELGTLSTQSDNLYTTFTAPAHIDPAILFTFPEAFLHINILIPGKNGKTKTIKNPTLYRTLRFVPYYTYEIKINMTGINLSLYYGDIYVDSASFQVDVDPEWKVNADGSRDVANYLVTLSKEVNSPPDDEPKHFEDNSYKIDWIPDSYGLINIMGATTAIADAWNSRTIGIVFYEPGTKTPGWTMIDKSSGDDVGSPPTAVPGVPASLVFSFWDSSQTQYYNWNPELQISVWITSQ